MVRGRCDGTRRRRRPRISEFFGSQARDPIEELLALGAWRMESAHRQTQEAAGLFKEIVIRVHGLIFQTVAHVRKLSYAYELAEKRGYRLQGPSG